MKTNLFVNFYCDSVPARQEELVVCIVNNAKAFDNVIALCTAEDEQYYSNLFNVNEKIIIIKVDTRPTYETYFLFMSKGFPGAENINVIANLDIIVPLETLQLCQNYFVGSKKTCLALTRWDLDSEGIFKNAVLFDRPDSQDTWVFNGGVTSVKADFCQGTAGCDNAIAERLNRAGYEVLNPSRSLKTYHLHNSGIRNYITENRASVPPPYKLLPPTL